MTDQQSSGSIAVVIVNWNSWQLTLQCLLSLNGSTGVAWHAYVVDNASTDDSLDHLVDLGDRVSLIVSPINGGWTGGNNLGIQRAIERGHQRLFILNSDAQVLPDTMAILVAQSDAMDPPPILGPVHLDEDGVTPDWVGASCDPVSGMPYNLPAHKIVFSDRPELYASSYIKGAGLFIDRAHIEAIGYFDDRYYLNYDETDWCFRARQQGYEVVVVKASRIIHAGSGSIGGGWSPLNVYFLTRNALLFSSLHCTVRQRAREFRRLISWGMEPMKGSRTRKLAGLLSGRSSLAKAWRAGVRDYGLRRFGDCPAEIRLWQSRRGSED